jgi:hypothetical protein
MDSHMSQSYNLLFEAIRTKCQRERWFGPELLSPEQREYVPDDDPHRFGFVFAPATEEQLQATEIELGCPLPPLLRALYAQVANGGFGPGTGLRGVYNGYKGIYPDQDGSIPNQKHIGTFSFTTYQEQASQAVVQGKRAHMIIPHGNWLNHLLPICDLGCCEEACIDSQERVFIVAPIDSDEAYGLFQLPWNFEELLWRWVRNEDIMN